METLKTAVLSACMLSCAVGMLSLISPGGALARQMRFLLSVLFAVSLAVPLVHLELPPDLGTLAQEELAAQTQALESRVQEELITQTQERAAAALTGALEKAGITCTALTVQVHIDEESCIHINKVTAECDDFSGACALLSDLLGEEADIRVTQVLS